MIFIGMTSTMKSTWTPNETPQIQEGLISRIAQGDQDALAMLYRETSSAVYGFALSILKDRHAAEDVMQDAYLTIHASAGRYEEMGKPMAWILTIVRNLARMRLRQERGGTVPVDEAWDLADPDDRFGRQNDRMLLQAAMECLSDEERQIVTLYAVSGLRHREIAGLLERPLPTVLSKYRRALQKLRRWMEENAE